MRTMLPTEACAEAVLKWGWVTLTGSVRSAEEPVPPARASSVLSSIANANGWFSLRQVTAGAVRDDAEGAGRVVLDRGIHRITRVGEDNVDRQPVQLRGVVLAHRQWQLGAAQRVTHARHHQLRGILGAAGGVSGIRHCRYV